MIIVGIVVIVLALISASTRGASKDKTKIRGGGVIMIGPIPIIFGTDKQSVKTAIRLALALTIALIILALVYYWLLR
jgi:uncharacterized protein (TIGR00304 family)